MKMLVLVAVLAAAALGLSCNRGSDEKNAPTAVDTSPDAGSPSAAGTKQVWILFTKNHGKGMGSPYNTDCVASVGTERIGAQRGYKIKWHLKRDNGGNNDDDKCDMLDFTKVSLKFNTDVMGAAAMRELKPTGVAGTTIDGTISMLDEDVGSILDHKYQVFYDGQPAGPDPIIVLGCSSCGPPPEE